MPDEMVYCRFGDHYLPATAEYFYNNRRTGGLHLNSRCRSCEREYRDALARQRCEAREWLSGRAQTPRGPRASPTRQRARGERTFGVELEFTTSVDREQIVQELADRGLTARVEGYNHTTRRWWKLTTDSSCGYELVSPPLSGEAGRRDVRRACEALQAAGAELSSSCGMHVHFGMAGVHAPDIIRAVRGYVNSQDAINWFVDQSRRRENSMCVPLEPRVVRRLEALTTTGGLRDYASNMDHYERFRTINVRPYATYGTIELRQHQGTLNARKVLAWIDFGMALFDAAIAGTELSASTPEELVASLQEHGRLSEATGTYLLRRAEGFRQKEREREARQVLREREAQRRVVRARRIDRDGVIIHDEIRFS